MSPKRTPWGAWLRCGLALGIAPHRFWRLSLREWRALSGGGGEAALRRLDLEGLMARFPDGQS